MDNYTYWVILLISKLYIIYNFIIWQWLWQRRRKWNMAHFFPWICDACWGWRIQSPSVWLRNAFKSTPKYWTKRWQGNPNPSSQTVASKMYLFYYHFLICCRSLINTTAYYFFQQYELETCWIKNTAYAISIRYKEKNEKARNIPGNLN